MKTKTVKIVNKGYDTNSTKSAKKNMRAKKPITKKGIAKKY